MKKLLLTTAAVAAFASSAVADDMFYLRADVLGSSSPAVKFGDYKFNNKTLTPGLDLGVGYGLMDNVRTELVYNHMFENKMKLKGNSASKYKQKAHALMVRGLVDVFDFGMGQAYAGLGLGWGQVSAKATISDEDTVDGKAKAKNNFAWSAHVGAGFDVADGVKLDVAYSYRDFGKTNKLKVSNVAAPGSDKSVHSHNLSAGVRFDI